MNEIEIRKSIARQEFIHDQLDAELQDLDYLLKLAGFSEGLRSMKDVARQLIEEGQEES